MIIKKHKLHNSIKTKNKNFLNSNKKEMNKILNTLTINQIII